MIKLVVVILGIYLILWTLGTIWGFMAIWWHQIKEFRNGQRHK